MDQNVHCQGFLTFKKDNRRAIDHVMVKHTLEGINTTTTAYGSLEFLQEHSVAQAEYSNVRLLKSFKTVVM